LFVPPVACFGMDIILMSFTLFSLMFFIYFLFSSDVEGFEQIEQPYNYPQDETKLEEEEETTKLEVLKDEDSKFEEIQNSTLQENVQKGEIN
jgi:hypothetical protein